MAQDNPPDEETGPDAGSSGGSGSAGRARPDADGAGGQEAPGRDSATDHAGTEHAGTDHAGTGDSSTEHAGTEHTATGDSSTEQAGTEQAGTEHVGTGDSGTGDSGASGPDTDAVSTQEPGQQATTQQDRPPWAYGAPPYPGTEHPAAGEQPYPQAGAIGAAPQPRRPRRTLVLIVGGLVLALVAGAVGGAIGTDIARSSASGGGVLADPVPEVESDLPVTPVEAVSARVLPSVVQLRVEGGGGNTGGRGEGSGMVISEDGLILTNNHVVEPAASGGTLRAVLQDGRVAVGSVVGGDPQSDVALVQVQLSGLTPVELGNSESVRVGQQVTAFGSPLGLGGSVTTGIVSALDRAVSVGGEAGNASTVLNAIQTDAAINPGNSGGPLVDMQGRVVGINSAIATAGPGGGSIGVGFSIPVNQARRVADQLQAGGPATHAVLGVEVSDDPQLGGAVVRTVAPGGAAEQAGLRPDDLVVRLGDQRISSGTDLQAAVRSQPPGAVVELQLRDRTVEVTLGEQ